MLSPAEFKTRVRGLRDELENPERVNDLVEVFSFTPDRSSFEEVSEEVWLSHRSGLVRLVRHLIDEVVEGAHAYNAAKHGLALGAGELELQLGPEGEEPLFDHRGPALNYLELHGASDDRHWRLTSTFINPPRNIAVISMVLREMRSLWNVAKTMRRVQGDESAELYLFSLATVQEVLEGDRQTGFIPKGFSERLQGPN